MNTDGITKPLVFFLVPGSFLEAATDFVHPALPTIFVCSPWEFRRNSVPIFDLARRHLIINGQISGCSILAILCEKETRTLAARFIVENLVFHLSPSFGYAPVEPTHISRLQQSWKSDQINSEQRARIK